MARLNQPFNAHNVDPTQGTSGLPIGKHRVVIVESEIKATKANDGGMLELILQIIEGDMQGTTGAYRLNLYNANPQASEIAQRQLSAICHVTGVYEVEDSSQLHNIPFMVEVGLQKGENPNGYTEVKKVFDVNGNEPGKGNSGADQSQQNQQNNNGGSGGWNNGGNNNGNQAQQNNQQTDAQNGGGGWGNGQSNNNQDGGGQQSGGWQQNNGGNNGGPSWGKS